MERLDKKQRARLIEALELGAARAVKAVTRRERLAAEYPYRRAARIAPCPKCGYCEVNPVDEVNEITLSPWWSGRAITAQVTKSHMTGEEILSLMRSQNLQMPDEGREVLMLELVNGTARVIGRKEQIKIFSGMKFTTMESNDNA